MVFALATMRLQQATGEVLTERDFGVGWAVNLPSLFRFASEVAASK